MPKLKNSKNLKKCFFVEKSDFRRKSGDLEQCVQHEKGKWLKMDNGFTLLQSDCSESTLQTKGIPAQQQANQFYGLKLAFATWFGGMTLLSHSRERNWLWVLVVVVGWFTLDFIPYFLLLLMDISWENSMRYTVGQNLGKMPVSRHM